MKHFRDDSRKIYMVIIVTAVLVLAVLIGTNLALSARLPDGAEEDKSDTSYQYHIAMISGNPSDVFWTSVYKGAKEQGMKQDCFVENFGADLTEEYTVAELVEMAMAAKVDGIIVEPDKSEETGDAIDRASLADIPVITVGTDATDSMRKSFVSANDYALGETYGSQVIDVLQDREENEGSVPKVAVLVNSGDDNSEPNLIYSGISESAAKNYREIELNPVVVDGSGNFRAEETIRNLFLDIQKRPDVIVCLDAADTISAYQCVVDYNLVGKITIIGYYESAKILEGIQKGIIKSTVVINTQEMGKVSIQGMYEYKTKEYVSEYLPVASELITQENVQEYIEKENSQNEDKEE